MMRSISRLWWKRYLSRNAVPWEPLARFPALNPGQQRQELARLLLAQIRYFGSREDALPEWREAARISDPLELWRVWPSLPLVTKQDLRTRFHPAEMQRRFGLVGRLDATGGSTGEPTQFFLDRQMLLTAVASDIYTRLKMGWQLGMPTIVVWGAERDIGKSVPRRVQFHLRMTNEHQVAAYELTAQTVERVRGLVERLRPAALYGFTSMLDYVARGILESGGRVDGVAAAWNGGEMLFDDQRERFQQAFGTPLHNRYGGRELSCIAAELAAGGPLEILRPWVFVEFVNQAGKPAAAGEPARLVCTSTVCTGTPFLRYEIGDCGVFEAGAESEAGVRAIAHLEGRSAGVIRLAGGRQINALYWNHLFKGYPEVRQFQVVIEADDSLKVLLEGERMTPERQADASRRMASFLGETRFEMAWVERIPRTRQGKLVQVVRAAGLS